MSPGLRADLTYLPGTYFDTNKYHINGVDRIKNYVWGTTVTGSFLPFAVTGCDFLPQDTNANWIPDPGEDWSETIGGVAGEWRVWIDDSCWAATANNLVRYISGHDPYFRWMYEEGVIQSYDIDESYWWDGGQVEEALDWDNWDNTEIWVDPPGYTWDFNPEEWIRVRLEMGKPVGASVRWDSESGHAFTIYGIDTTNNKFLIANSDADEDDPDDGLPAGYCWRNYRWNYQGNSRFQIDFSNNNTWNALSCFTTFETRIWSGAGSGGSGTNWDSPFAWAGDADYDVDEIALDSAAVVKVTDMGNISTRLVLYGAPTVLDIESGGGLDVKTLMLREQANLEVSGGGRLWIGEQASMDGNVNLVGGEIFGLWNEVYVGDQENAVFNHQSGVVDLYQLHLGYRSTAAATYTLGSGRLSLVDGDIGMAGAGTLRITGGQVLPSIYAHDNGSGPISDTDTALRVGTASGTGVLEINNNGELRIGNLQIGTNGVVRQSGTSSVTVLDQLDVDGSGTNGYELSSSTTLDAARIVVGDTGSGRFSHTGGTVDVGDALSLGRASGSAGQYTLDDGDLTGGTLRIGWGGSGIFQQNGGDVFFSEVVLGEAAGSSGLWWREGGYAEMSELIVGLHGTATLKLDTGICWPGQLRIGEGTGSDGTVDVRGDSTLNAQTVEVGRFGHGSLRIMGEGVGNFDSLIIGNGTNSTGTVEVMGTGRLEADSLLVGNLGQASFSQLAGDVIAPTLEIRKSGSLDTRYTLSNGRLFTNTSSIGGDFLHQGGRHDTGRLVVGSRAGINADYALSNGNLNVVDVVLGSAGPGRLAISGGIASVEGTVRIGDGMAGTLAIDAGTFHAGDSQVFLGSSGRIEMGYAAGTSTALLVADELMFTPGAVLSTGSENPDTALRLNRVRGVTGILNVPGELQLGHTRGTGLRDNTIQAMARWNLGTLQLGWTADSELTLAQGGFLLADDLEAGHGNGIEGVLTVRGTALCTNVRLGTDGTGSLHLEDGSMRTDLLVVGAAAGGTGVCSIASGNLDAIDVTIGGAGAGTLNHHGGFTKISGTLRVGLAANVSGVCTIDGGSITANSLLLGELGRGRVRQLDGLVTVNGTATVGADPSGWGTYEMWGGTLNVSALVVGPTTGNLGQFLWDGGTVQAGSLRVQSKGGLLIGQNVPTPQAWTLPANSTFDPGSIVLAANDDLVFSGEGNVGFAGQLTARGLSLRSSTVLNGVQSGGQTNVTNFTLGTVMPGSSEVSFSLSGGTLQANTWTVHWGTLANQIGGTASAATLQLGVDWGGAARYLLNGGSLDVGTLRLDGSGTHFDWVSGTAEFDNIIVGSGATFVSPGSWTYSGNLALAGGTLDLSGGSFNFSDRSGYEATFEQSGGTLSADDLVFCRAGNGGAMISGGAIDLTGDFLVATTPAARADIKLTGGQMTVGGTIGVGESGQAEIRQIGPATVSATSLRLGTAAGSAGTYQISAGTVQLTANLTIGGAGLGTVLQSGGGVHVGTQLELGTDGGTGIWQMTNGSPLYLQRVYGAEITIGKDGTGVFQMGDADDTGRIYEEGTETGRHVSLTVRANEKSQGTLSGWGLVNLTGRLLNNGRVIADGFGQDRDLDLSSMGDRIENSVENRADNGWHAIRGGQLILPPLTLTDGDGNYRWGEQSDDPTIDLVNSIHISINRADVGANNLLGISLLATDRSDVPALPGALAVWDFDPPADMTFESAWLGFRYDDILLADMGCLESGLQVMQYDGRDWFPISGTTDTENNIISTKEIQSFSMFALTGGEASYEFWTIIHGLSGRDAEPDANPTRDGIVNLLKYAFRMDPTVPAIGADRILQAREGLAGLPFISIGQGNRLLVEFVRRRAPTDILYQVEFCSKPGASDETGWREGPPPVEVQIIDAEWERVFVIDSNGPPDARARFARVAVTK